jgi:ribonuclease T
VRTPQAINVGRGTPSYSHAMRHGDVIYVAGQVARAPDGLPLEGGLSVQGRAVLERLDAVLRAAGSAPENVVRTTCYLAAIEDATEFDEMYRTFFPEPRPARTTLAVTLASGILVEVDAIAVVDDRQQSPGQALISVDVEASGLTAMTGSLLSIGACEVVAPARQFYVELRPLSDRPWSRAAEQIHGLDRARLAAEGMEPEEAMRAFDAWVDELSGPRAPVFVGLNAAFDWQFVSAYFDRYLGRNPFGTAALDLAAYAMGRDGIVSWGDVQGPSLRRRYRSTLPHTHHALDDALDQAELARHILRIAPTQ